MVTVKTLSKGQVVIPAKIRKRYNIKAGSELHVLDYGGIIYLIPPVDDPIEPHVAYYLKKNLLYLPNSLKNVKRISYEDKKGELHL